LGCDRSAGAVRGGVRAGGKRFTERDAVPRLRVHQRGAVPDAREPPILRGHGDRSRSRRRCAGQRECDAGRVAMTTTAATSESARIREQLPHPVIDGDGHYAELWVAFEAFARDHGAGHYLEQGWRASFNTWYSSSAAERARSRAVAPPF